MVTGYVSITYKRLSWCLEIGSSAGGLCRAGMKVASRLNSAITTATRQKSDVPHQVLCYFPIHREYTLSIIADSLKERNNWGSLEIAANNASQVSCSLETNKLKY